MEKVRRRGGREMPWHWEGGGGGTGIGGVKIERGKHHNVK